MQFPTTKLRDGIQRPLVMLHLEATNGRRVNVDALVDTGADISLFSFSTAAQLLKLANGQAAPLGWVDGNAGQIGNQLVGAAVGIGLAVCGTLVALKVTDVVTPLRLEARDEVTGMDLAIHGEEGYNLDT